MRAFPHLVDSCSEFHDIVRDFRGPSPEIVVLSGSTRFADQHRAEAVRLTISGKIVLGHGLYLDRDAEFVKAAGLKADDDLMLHLQQLHHRRIDLADVVRVVNIGGHIGDMTRYEIEYAYGTGKKVEFVELPL